MDVLVVGFLVAFGVSLIRHGQRSEDSGDKTFGKWYGWLMILAAGYWAWKFGLLARLLSAPQ